MVNKYYAVISGHQPGVYTDWSTAERMIQNYPGAFFKSCSSRKEADDCINNIANNNNTQPLIYVFGNDDSGYGLLIKSNDTEVTAYGRIDKNDRIEKGFSTIYGIYIGLSLVTGSCIIFHNLENDIKNEQLERAIKEKIGTRKVVFKPLVDAEIEEKVKDLAKTGSNGNETYVVFKNGVKQS